MKTETTNQHKNQKMNAKLKLAVFLLLLFAGLLVFVTVEHSARLRPLVPIAGVGLFGYIVYCAVSLLRNSKKLDNDAAPAPTEEPCGDGCGCHPKQNTRPQTPKAAQKVSK